MYTPNYSYVEIWSVSPIMKQEKDKGSDIKKVRFTKVKCSGSTA